MSEDRIAIKTPLLSIGLSKREKEIRLKTGEAVIIRDWSWKNFGYKKKLVRLVDGETVVEVL